jgi:hypothetical protein
MSWINPRTRQNPAVIARVPRRSITVIGDTPGAAGAYSVNGANFTLTAPNGVSFGVKPRSPKPLLVWTADGGMQPDATLGRLSAWVGTPNGAITTEEAGPGSSSSVVLDCSQHSGQILSWVHFPAEAESVIMNRRRRDNFTAAEALNTRVLPVNYAGAPLVPGMWIRGVSSGLTGEIIQIREPGNPNTNIYLHRDKGTLWQGQTPKPKLINGEILEYFSDETLTNKVGEAQANPGTNVINPSYTYNNKVLRFYPGGNYANLYWYEQPTRMSATFESGFVNPAGRAANVVDSNMQDEGDTQDSVAHKWLCETFVFRHSSAPNIFDGQAGWRRGNKQLLLESGRLRTRNTELRNDLVNTYNAPRVDIGPWPDKQFRMAGAQAQHFFYLGSKRYQDFAIYEDSEYYVLQVNAAGDHAILPCSAWGNETITCRNMGLVPDWTDMHVYSNGVVVASYARAA